MGPCTTLRHSSCGGIARFEYAKAKMKMEMSRIFLGFGNANDSSFLLDMNTKLV